MRLFYINFQLCDDNFFEYFNVIKLKLFIFNDTFTILETVIFESVENSEDMLLKNINSKKNQ